MTIPEHRRQIKQQALLEEFGSSSLSLNPHILVTVGYTPVRLQFTNNGHLLTRTVDGFESASRVPTSNLCSKLTSFRELYFFRVFAAFFAD